MLGYIKLWWKVRKLKKALWRQVKIDAANNKKYIARRHSYWKKNGNIIWQ